MRLAQLLLMREGFMLAAVVAAAGIAGPATGKDAAAAARGEAIAQQACASCHGMGLSGESGWRGAPPFRDMKLDLNAVAYERRLAQMHVGRVSMPPADVTLDELSDIRAYIKSLKAAKAR